STSLHAATEHRDHVTLKLLVSAPCDQVLDSFDYISRTPLMIAAESQDVIAASLLLESGANVNTHDEQKIGNTAIRCAAEVGSVEMVKLLLHFGADPTIPGWMNLTAIHKAQERPGKIKDEMILAMKDAVRRLGRPRS